MNKIEIAALVLTGLLVVVIVIVCVVKRKDLYTHLPGLITFPPNKHLPPRTLNVNAPLGVPNTKDNKMEQYSLDTTNKSAKPLTFAQAYLDPPNLIDLPAYKKLIPPNEQRLHVVSGIPEGMYRGSDYMYSQYTPDYLACKAGVI
jgi:hypothetical protein